MGLGDRIRQWLDPVASPTGGDHGSGHPAGLSSHGRRRGRTQAQPISTSRFEQRPMQRTQWLGLGLAAAAAVALTAMLVFVVLTVTSPGGARPAATPTGIAVAASPTTAIADIFATSTPTSPPAPPTPTSGLVPTGERVQIGNTGGEGVNLRREPSTSAERVKGLPEGAVVEVIGPDRSAEGRTWRNVRDAEGDTGWVPVEFLVAVGTPPSAPAASEPASTPAARPTSAPAPTARAAPAGRAQVGNTNGQGANVRSEPGGGRILKTLPEGTPVETTGAEREVDGRIWRQIRDPAGVVGWIVGGALVPPGTVPTPPPPGSRPTSAPSTAPPPSPLTPAPATPATPARTATPSAPAPTPSGPILLPPSTPRPSGSPTP